MTRDYFDREEAESLVGRRVRLTRSFRQLDPGTHGLVVEASKTIHPTDWIVRVEWYDMGPVYTDFHTTAEFMFHWFSKDGFNSFLEAIDRQNDRPVP